jgi:hypothetical protein
MGKYNDTSCKKKNEFLIINFGKISSINEGDKISFKNLTYMIQLEGCTEDDIDLSQ